MSYCLNTNCPNPQNPKGNKSCQTCGSKLLLAERYRAVRLIGQGGFGRTLLAEDEYKPSKPRCVIKQFYPQGQNNAPKGAELFHCEAMRLEQLGKHPQIPELLAHFEQDNSYYIVQEFIEGQSLAVELAETRAFRESQIKSLLLDLLPVLQFIHTGQVIHRDIKPENIIRRCSNGSLVLVDFGAAKFASATALAKTGTTIGSAGYAAPEQSFGKAVFASALYSLGVTCIHLLTRIEPFDLYDASESGFVWRNYLVNNPVSGELGRILDKMIQVPVKQRYQSAAQVLQDLNSFVIEPSQSSRVTQANPSSQPRRQNPLTAAAQPRETAKTTIVQPQFNWRVVSVVLLVGLVGYGYGLWQSHHTQPKIAPQFSSQLTVEPAIGVNISGRWQGNDGGIYYLRQLGNEVWWYGEYSATNPNWSNVFKGKLQGNQLVGQWADVPKGSILQSGEMVIEVTSNNTLRAISKTGGFGGSEWTRP